MRVELSAADRERLWSKVWPEPMSGCWLWGDAPNARGVGVMNLRRDGRSWPTPAHRLSYEEHRGTIPAGMVVHQRCGQLLCVNPEHLELRKRGWHAEDAAERFARMVKANPETGCHEWTGSQIVGYGQFSFKRKPRLAHRFSWELHHGPIPDGLWALHKCDNRLCVNPEHLFLGTHQDNVDDMVSKGRSARGEHHGMARLTESQVIAIRSAKGRHVDIGKEFGVSRECVGLVKRRRNWGWLNG